MPPRDPQSPAPASTAYLGLARKWRPARFDDLVGQDAVAQSLARALEGNRLVHGHLLAGPRGVGKTTSARILARAVNCAKGPTATPCGDCRHCIDIAAGTDLDVIEIDAASNTGVDNMRELLEGTVRAPFSARFKVYIIDEVHMLSMGAFNALLKTLEEPPSHVMFIFATTELEKIPETIRSRCIVHRFRRLGTEDIIRRLSEVARGEGVELSPEEAKEIFGLFAEAVDGGMRDALVAFDQLLSLTHGKPTVEAARDLLGLSSQALLARTLEAVARNDAASLLRIVEDLVNQGRSLERFVKGLIGYVHSVMVLQAVPSQTPASMSGEIAERTRALSAELSQVAVFNLMNQLLELEERLKLSVQPRFLVEFTFLRLVAVRPVLPLDDIIGRIQALPPQLDAAPGRAGPESAPGRAHYSRDAPEPSPSRVGESFEPGAPPVPGRRLGFSTLAAASPSSLGTTNVLSDSAPAAVAPAPDSPPAHEPGPVMPPDALASLTRGELIDLIIPALPETHRFLGRYLKASVEIQWRDGTLWVHWPRNDRVGSTMFAKQENRQAFEAVLSRICGRPARLESAFSERAESPPESPPQREPSLRTADAVSPPPAPGAFRDSGGEAPSGPVGSGAAVPADTPEPDSGAPAHVLPRVTEAETRTLLAQDADFARRARMVRDFFEGSFVDHAGRPIAV